MSQKKLISVIATRSQGGSVIKSLLNAGNFKVRALLRNPDSEQSKELGSLGAEIVKCDIGTDSKEAIEKAIAGSDGLYLVTVFWNYMGKESEVGKKAVDAALAAKIGHLVFSSLAPANKISGGRYHVPHFDEKNAVEEYARELSKKHPEFKSSFVYAPFYMQNFNTFFKVQKGADNEYSLSLPVDPSSKFPLDMADIDDIGPIVKGIFSNPTKYAGLSVPFSGSALTGDEIAQAISKNSGKPVKFNYVPTDIFAKAPFPGASEMAEMFAYYNEFGAFDKLNKDLGKELTTLTTFDQFLQKNPIQFN
ncbi:hypothetical protein DICPUDRAFT_38177 [Dictyostelium purpureum]|uniref:NmrA-like domain-containing protein n=1 Tax=Dictyostelium purpureum TaxID=5786 RepID=F0ZTX9_DICPU|nr:uncharacterized protein DICPUDRAFT_38177 [Dictyostelium purpureum]EGC32581.1 hypothetical protein DICPUDRAFT_38177 [Dictyostelium purpureum]|eukprot:XP_003290872.1 hypothetical protein DICPUDRAFT_38177 [Dictyostelium purpureum]